jgi:phage terminase small subunit
LALNEKQQRFADEYLVDLNATQAAIRAGYSEQTAKQQGSRLLTHADVQAAITAGQQARSERTGISQDRVLEELAAVAFSRLSDVATWAEDGELVMVPSSDLAPAQLAALREVRSTTSTVVFKDGGERTTVYKAVKQHDKIRALEMLGRHVGLWKEGGLPDGPIEVQLLWPEQEGGAG